jgi:serine protease Do
MKLATPLPPAALLATFAMVMPALAQDPGIDPAPAPAPEAAVELQVQAVEVQGQAVPAAKAEIKPFLGLGACPVPGFLGKHLNLPADSGVMIRSLAPDGPAAKAGFTVDDVITKVDGKAVATHSELVDGFLTKKPGDEIAIDFIHEGKPGTRSVKLGERTAAPDAAANPNGGPEIKVLEGQLNLPNGIGGLGLGGIKGIPAPDMEKRLRDAMDQALKLGVGNQMQLKIVPGGAGGVQIIPGNGGNGPQNGLRFGVASSINMMDDQGSIELKNVDGGSEIRVTDHAGKEVWSGPWDTDQDKAAAPPAIRKRVERLNIVQGQRQQLMPNPAPEEDEDEPADAPAAPK